MTASYQGSEYGAASTYAAVRTTSATAPSLTTRSDSSSGSVGRRGAGWGPARTIRANASATRTTTTGVSRTIQCRMSLLPTGPLRASKTGRHGVASEM